MPVIALERDRPCRLYGVEVLSRRLEPVIVELRRLEPFVGAARILGETRLNHRLQGIERGLDAGKAALGAVDRADDRMDVRVQHAGQDELSIKVDDLGLGPDHLLDVGIVADGDDGIAGEGDGLLDGAGRIGRIDFSVAENDVGFALFFRFGVGGR